VDTSPLDPILEPLGCPALFLGPDFNFDYGLPDEFAEQLRIAFLGRCLQFAKPRQCGLYLRFNLAATLSRGYVRKL
jgi:hypothetical protein